MSKKRNIQRGQARAAETQAPKPRQIQQLSFSGTYDVENDRIESFSSSPANLNPLALLRALHALEMQLMAAVVKANLPDGVE